MVVKYISLEFFEDYIRKKVKRHNGESIIWKAIVRGFPLVGKWMERKIGRDNSIRSGRIHGWETQEILDY
jgi:hypothetical protein